MKTIWQKTPASTETGDWFFEFTAREDRECDQHLIPFDIFTNLAQARMLGTSGIYKSDEAKNVVSTLSKLYLRWEKGEYQLGDDDEDVHSAIEKYLTIELGDTGKKIHTGRSRNDQVLTDIRLFMKHEIRSVVASWVEIGRLLNGLAKEYRGVYFAGFTHTQPAMPSSVDAWAAGYLDLLLADLQSLLHAYEINDRCPLGSAAGYGAPYFEIDRGYLSEALGFSNTQEAVAAAQLSRGTFELRIVDALGYGAGTFNRMAGDVIWFLNPMLGLVELNEDQVSGSSIMPQKRNPDVWELIRGVHHEYTGWSSQMASLATNLTSGYHRDLQLTKKTVMQSAFAGRRLATAVTHALKGLSFNRDAARQSLTPALMATHKANGYVNGGMPFREAYLKVAGELDSLSVKEFGDLYSTYSHIGAPGHYEEKSYLEKISPIEEWLRREEKKWNQVKIELLNERL
ncbi:MAG: lyase family protein [Balneolales bacterium]